MWLLLLRLLLRLVRQVLRRLELGLVLVLLRRLQLLQLVLVLLRLLWLLARRRQLLLVLLVLLWLRALLWLLMLLLLLRGGVLRIAAITTIIITTTTTTTTTVGRRLLLSLLLARVLLLLVCRVALLWRQLELALDVSGAGRVDKCPSLTARVAVVPQDVVEVRPSEDGGGGCSSHGALMGAVAWKVMEDACSRQRVSHARTAGAFTFLCCSQRCGSRLC